MIESVDQFLARLKKRDPDQPEFHQIGQLGRIGEGSARQARGRTHGDQFLTKQLQAFGTRPWKKSCVASGLFLKPTRIT